MKTRSSVQPRSPERLRIGIAKNIGPYLRCSIGIAPNRYLAKVGTELERPDGLVVLNAADLPQRLFSLKLRDLPGIAREARPDRVFG